MRDGVGAADSNYSPRETIIHGGLCLACSWVVARATMAAQAPRHVVPGGEEQCGHVEELEWAKIDRLSEDSGNAR